MSPGWPFPRAHSMAVRSSAYLASGARSPCTCSWKQVGPLGRVRCVSGVRHTEGAVGRRGVQGS